MDGQEIALRMIQVAEAASVAAQSAAEALGRRSEGDKNWFRVLPKPANFDAKKRAMEGLQLERRAVPLLDGWRLCGRHQRAAEEA